ncbi:hypothetical protein V6N11_004880 [Hibiscus sabdariffa]|uniref:Uncharacterized protein n=1 Tax=Hibiscus sabdariffa TaxID=183260 RepID=A0ABR2SHV1_9ROSI
MVTDQHNMSDLVDQNSAETVQGKPQTVDRNFTEKRSSTRGQSRAYGEMSTNEDKDADLFLLLQPLDVSSAEKHFMPIQPEKQPTLIENQPIQPEKQPTSTPIKSAPSSPQAESNTPQTPQPNTNISQPNIQDSTRPLQIYSRRKAPMQIQSPSSPAPAPTQLEKGKKNL